LDEAYQPAFFQMLLHPVLGAEIVYKIQINGAKNQLYAGQKRNSANDVIRESVALMYDDSNLTQRWNEVLDGKWAHMLDQTHLGYDGYWQQPMRNTLPDLRYVQDVFPSLGGQYGIGVEGSNASIQGDSKWHALSSSGLEMLPLSPWGAASRYIDVFSRGPKHCNWQASPWEPYVQLSQYNGTVGGDNGTDTRIYMTIDWANAPAAPNRTEVFINITSDCRGYERYAGAEPRLTAIVESVSVPDNFTEGFVEADGHVAIEASHYQSILEGTSGSSSSSPSNSTGSNSTSVSRRQDSNETAPAYHTLRNYGRTLAGVGLYPLDSEKLEVGEGPALEYSVYLFTNHSAANVTVYMSPGANYLGDNNPLQYAIALFPAGDEQPEPAVVTPIGPNVGSNMPDGWGQAVANAVWGLQGNYTTSPFNVTQEGAYTLRIWALLPNIVVQKIVIDLGGVRDSYLGPPESFLVGRDERGSYNGTSFATTPGIVGGVDHNRTSLPGGGESEEADGSNEASNGAGGLASIINRLLEVGYTAASHVVKPDGSCIPVEKFSPSKRGTPKRFFRRRQPLRKPINARKGVSFTPVKKKAASQRSVRWRDDESEDGTLADFDKTPKKYESTPEQNSPDKALPLPPMPAMSSLPAMPTLPVYLETTEEEPEPASDSSPSLELPETSTLVPTKPNRFQAGFLSKGSARVSSIGSGSPSLPTPTFSVKLAPSPSSSDNGDKLGPLRSLDVSRSSNLSPSSFGSKIARLSPPRCSFLGDENNPPSIASGHSSDSDSSKIDHQKLRNALHSAKKAGGRRVSSMSGSTTTSARRISSIGPLPERAGHRASLSYSGPLASSTNGISRHRRNSTAERRRSPPIACSPPDFRGAFTQGQARRMN
ncbi:hypothetical protein BN1723_017894, partial [Verticillium longisporum]